MMERRPHITSLLLIGWGTVALLVAGVVAWRGDGGFAHVLLIMGVLMLPVGLLLLLLPPDVTDAETKHDAPSLPLPPDPEDDER